MHPYLQGLPPAAPQPQAPLCPLTPTTPASSLSAGPLDSASQKAGAGPNNQELPWEAGEGVGGLWSPFCESGKLAVGNILLRPPTVG